MFDTLSLDSVFFSVFYVSFEGCFWSQIWALVFRWLAFILPPSGCFFSSNALQSYSLGALIPSIQSFVACVFVLQGDFSLPVILLLLTRFLGSVCWCLITLFCVRGIALSQILSFYSFMTPDSPGQDTLWLFLVSSLALVFGGWLPFSFPQVCGVNLSEFGSASYLLAGGRVSGALGMCLPASW
ncbi:hypothetical protein F2Q68_00020203 [Brassica cretica]|uniref:Uncharacterized protein n=1 Tax=Brassica cretica TaxID=69181 RepID=A0A8S9FT45_BRACR|nr:hypothetical protein F2Q68_00020203 [Brassica cretica]